jgi:hypothetical protein
MLLWDPTNARAKLKIRGYPNKRTTQLMLPASFLLVQDCGSQKRKRFGAKKMVAKALDFAKQKIIAKDILDCFVTLFLAMTE